MTPTKARINLKYKEIDGGRKSIYLDYYSNGKRIREGLRLYLLPETTRKAKAENKAVIQRAMEIQRRRMDELTSSERNVEVGANVPDVPIASIIEEYYASVLGRGDKFTAGNIMGMKRALSAYRGEDVMLADVDAAYCDGLVDFLRYEYHSIHGKLRMTTARVYIYLFSGALNMAVEKGYITRNPLFFVKIHDRITRERPQKLFLSIEEVRLLMETQCPVTSRPQVKQAYLFSIFTGLTAYDIVNLKWKDLKTSPDGKASVWCRSRKIFIPLSSNAMRWLPETTNHRGLIFKGLPKETEINNILRLWQRKAGIEKQLNLSLARNTFAFLILSTGVEVATFCSLMSVKQGFLFSCYSGLRTSDIRALRWGQIQKDGDQWRVSVVMKKTATPIYLPLSSQAMKWLPERGDASDDDKVFSLPTTSRVSIILGNWAKAAGVKKDITFHVSRHTFATLMLTLDVDLYTTSKLLGHKNIATTQIYAKIIDQKKDDAVNRVDEIFS